MSQNIINIGYARVSTHKQDLGLEVQIDALKHCDQLFIERESGFQQCTSRTRKGLKIGSNAFEKRNASHFHHLQA